VVYLKLLFDFFKKMGYALRHFRIDQLWTICWFTRSALQNITVGMFSFSQLMKFLECRIDRGTILVSLSSAIIDPQ
jgi:hypothetical protein